MIKKTVTMSDIAKVMNVSTVTVSKALGDREGVSESLRERIKQKAAEMGYRIHTGGHAMKDGLTYNIGIIVAKHFISEPSAFYWIMYKYLAELLQRQNYFGILEVVEDGTDGSSEIPNSVRDKKIDGLILLGQFSNEYIDKLTAYYIPTVFLDFYGSRDDAETILSDNFYGAYILTSYLISCGHSKIGFLGNINSTSNVQDRYLGFYKAMLENRLPIRQDWIIGDRTPEGEIQKSFVLPQELPTAFMCSTDESAFHLVNRLQSLGYKVPEDISVTGYDNHIYSTTCQPHLTTMDVNSQAMATEAVDIILHKIRDGSYKRGRTLVAGKLIRRDSVKNLNNT